MSGTGNLGNIDLEDSQKGLPNRAYLPSSPEGSFRSSLEDGASAKNDQGIPPTRSNGKKSAKKKLKASSKAAAGKANYSSPPTSDIAAS